MKEFIYLAIISAALAYIFSTIDFEPSNIVDRGWNYSSPVHK
jgi:hypothetical protein